MPVGNAHTMPITCAFFQVIRQLLFELAEIRECMMDCKLEEADANRGGAVSYAKVNAEVDAAVRYFGEYLDTLTGGGGAGGEGNDEEEEAATTTTMKRFPSDSVRPALSAHFHLARLWDKYLVRLGARDGGRGGARGAETGLLFEFWNIRLN